MHPGDEEPVIALLEREWASMAALGAELEPGEWLLATECPGWSVHDLFAHIIGTERTLLGDPPPAPPTTKPSHVRNPIGEVNEAWIQARRAVPAPALLAEFDEVTARRLEALRVTEPERFGAPGPSPIGVVPYREFMSVRVMDCWVHEQDARVATGRPGHESGEVADVAYARITAAMPFVVGKRAGAPEGAIVRFDLTTSRSERIDIVVSGGRASVLAEEAHQPTAILVMDGTTFWRLGCGRITGAAARGSGLVELVGDRDLAGLVLDAMAFMI
jgi:uncharacterized protein (TIGR03083 family)